jgi:hypothetical protein
MHRNGVHTGQKGSICESTKVDKEFENMRSSDKLVLSERKVKRSR